MKTKINSKKIFKIVPIIILISLFVSMISMQTPLVNADDWANAHQIIIVGTTQGVEDILFNNGLDPAKIINPATLKDYNESMVALKTLTDEVVKGLEPQFNTWSNKIEQKTLYFCNFHDRGYASDMPQGYVSNIILKSGFTYATAGAYMQISINWIHLTIHEVAHIIDCVGTNRGEYYWTPVAGWESYAAQINSIFDAHNTITEYATTNTYEDFADCFTYYVLYGDTFRNMTIGHPAIANRYNFLKTMFKNVEYNGTSSSYYSRIDNLPVHGITIVEPWWMVQENTFLVAILVIAVIMSLLIGILSKTGGSLSVKIATAITALVLLVIAYFVFDTIKEHLFSIRYNMVLLW